jgi:[ribosomal protein S18]-alanine N-acetyltransferase
MSVRAAAASDLGDIMTIERDSFRGDAWSETSMSMELASPHNHYVVVEEAGRIVGYAGLRAPSGGPDADVQTIALAASARGHGRGRTLLRSLLSEASSRGMREVFLDVRDDNPVAQALYASEGFVEIGRRPNYYPDGPTDAVVMRLDLRGWTHAQDARPTGDAADTASAPAAEAGARGEWCS